MRLIDADDLMPLFIKKANTMKDRHGVKLGDEWLLNYNDIKDVIDNAPTVCNDNYSMGYQDGVRKVLSERPQGEIIKELWNCRNELCLKCERYKEAWNGACKDCRYNFANMKRWKEGSDEVADDKHL